ncbi:T9SS type B sorting domain-containing protein [Winogradskyella litoriviva]|uniref:T9SS type B sorting domain-containing protein n=1 Tax=Winogradskyella litoriviva TaxID=1220182 RepID=A0ABX2E6W4_9FLAO|nr:T9SS type B sorting domain-containing protein [Winogradskyella litoriviva]NRD23877.1 T9SS type B sorting domain-containing protein [Winogradskyella litoriviva]
MKKNYLVFILIISSVQLFAQNEASFWYFGQNAGLQFNAETGTVTAITNGQINTLEGCTSISDADGNLQFYSDGRTVWNSNHQIMSNGDYFGGTGLLGDPSSTSSGLIVPKPEDPTKYYLFTVDEPHHDNASAYPNQFTGTYDQGGSAPEQDDGFNNGFNYSLIDMTLNGGLGDVDAIEKNIHLVTYDPSVLLELQYKCSEKITAVRAEDCSSFWVITHFGNKFYAFRIDVNGVNTTPVVSTVGPNVPIEGYRRNSLGYLKASPDASKIIAANFGYATVAAGNAAGSVDLYDFNNETGVISNHLQLYGTENNASPYGVEFSAENRKVYATISQGAGGAGTSQVMQWDLESTDIVNSMQIIHTSSDITAGALQLGIDRRIYRAQLSYNGNDNISDYLGVIPNPEANGSLAGYIEQGILLDINGSNINKSRIGLPPFIQSLFNSEIDIIQNGISTTELKLCTNDSYTLQAENIEGADYFWKFNDTALTETSSQLFVDTPGFYEVYIEPNNGNCPIEGSAVVGVFDIPVANTLADIEVCDDFINDGFQSFDFTDKNSEALLTQDASIYNVHYYETIEDANSGENEITFPYTNVTNPQTIFVRVDNSENSNCYDINSFNLEVFSTPQFSDLNTIEICDNLNDQTDGIGTVNLEGLIPEIFGEQDVSAVSITFYSSEDNADTKTSAFPSTYTNTSAFNETIFARIENSLKTDCYLTLSFNLQVNPIPIANNLSIIQCDEDGIPEGFTVFNINNHIEEITDGSINSVEFYLSLIDAENQENAINANAFENYYNPHLIYARVTNTDSNCINFSEISLEVSTTSANNTSLELCDTDGAEDGFMTFNLSDANDSILAGTTADLELIYYETYEDALLEINPLSATYTNTMAYNQTIFGRVENANACYGISEIELTVFNLPNIETEFETIYCLNTYPETIVLNGGVIEDLPNNYYYEWSTGETTSEIEINEVGIYTVSVINTNGCNKVRTITVLPSDLATIEIEVVDASENNSITVFVNNENEYPDHFEYALDDEFGFYQDSNTFTNVLPGLHTIYVRNKYECGITETLVSVIGFPKFFTPNNDTINDFWQVYGITKQFQANSIIYIFDRYGKLLKELDPLSPGWDGNYNGHKMPTSDYWFKVTLEDGRIYTNHFTLKR